MSLKNVFVIIQKEARESIKNRWFIIYTVCFSALAIFLLFLASSKNDVAGFSGFSKTAASLINLVLLFIPLIALITGSISISSERENGTLSYILSHPITKSEIFVGKFLGILFSIWFSIFLGFGFAGIAIAINGTGGNISNYLITVFLSALLAASLLSVGFLVSVLTSKSSKAISIAIFLWLIFLVFGDLGIIGTTIAMNLGVEKLFFLTILNPVEVFKIASILVLSPRFEVLGPVGVYAMRTFGKVGIFYLLSAIMLLWIFIPFLYSYIHFCFINKEEK